MEHSNIIQLHHPSGLLYEAFCQFAKAHPEASFFQSDALFRMARQQAHAQATLLLALARNPALERSPAPGAAGKEAEHAEEESLFPGGALLFRGQKPPDPAPAPQPTPNSQPPTPNPQSPTPNSQPPTPKTQHPIPNTQSPTPNPQSPTPKVQYPKSNTQSPTPKAQPPIPNTQSPTPEESEIPGIGRIVGSLLAITFSDKPGWARGMRRQTVVFGGPLLADGTRLDQEIRLRNLLNALNRHVSRRSLSVNVFGFRSWDKLLPVFREAGFSDGLNPSALQAWKALWAALQESGSEAAREQEGDAPTSIRIDHSRLEKQLETCHARHGVLYKVNRPVMHFLFRSMFPLR